MSKPRIPLWLCRSLKLWKTPPGEEDVDLPGLGEVSDDKARLASGLLEVGDVEVLVAGIKPQAVALGEAG